MKNLMLIGVYLASTLGTVSMTPQGNSTVPSTLSLHATIENIGIVAPYTGDDNRNNSASILYRPTGTSSWLAGHEMYVDRAARQWRGSLVYLSPETLYEVQVQFTDPDGVSPSSMSGTVTTRPDYPDVGSGGRLRYVPDDGSLQAVIDAASPGDTIRIRDDVYYTSAVLGVEDSGTAGNYLTIEADPGAHVVLDGSDPEINDPLADDWTRYSSDSNIYYTDLAWGDRTCDDSFTVPNYVGEQRNGDGVRFLLYLGTSGWDKFVAAPVGKALYDCDGSNRRRLYVVTYEGDDPDNHEIHISRYPIGLLLAGADYVRIRNLELRYYGLYGIQLGSPGADHNVIEGNTLHGSKSKIFVGDWGDPSSSDNLIQDNYIYEQGYRDSRWTWDAQYHYASSYGIELAYARAGNVIRRNSVKSGTDGIDIVFQSHDTDVYENIFEESMDDAIEVDNEPGYNIRVWRNTIRDCYSGISNQGWFRGDHTNVGPIYVFRNVITGGGDPRGRTDTSGQVYYTGFAFKVGAALQGTGRAYYYHNTIFVDSPKGGNGVQDAGGDHFSGIVARNNIWRVSWRVFDLGSSASSGHSMDCDNVRNPDTPTDNNFVRWSDTIYKNLTAFQSSTGQEPHSISNEGTKFNSDYSLQAGSPEIDAGCVIVGFNDRGPDAYKGSKPDIGAFEYLDVPAAPDLSTSFKATSKGAVSTGESVTYTIRIVNTGELLTTTVRMTDTLPAGLEYITGTLTATPGTVWLPPGTVGLPPGSTIYWQGNLSNTSSAEIRFRVLVTADETEALVNTAEIDDGQGSVIRRSAIVIVNGLPVYLPVILRH